MKNQVSGFRMMLAALIMGVICPSLRATDCAPYTVYATDSLVRTSFNNVENHVDIAVDSDYWYNWNTYASSTLYLNSSQIDFGEENETGDSACVMLEEQPSAVGVGDFYSSGYGSAQCGAYAESRFPEAYLTVNQPTVNDDWGTGGNWWLGGPPYFDDEANGYYNYSTLTAEKNCGFGDTCSGTPQWHVTQNASKVSLDCSSCTQTKVNSAAASGSYQDVHITWDIDGFYADTLYYTVNSPRKLTPYATFDFGVNGTGYESDIYYETTIC